MPCAAPPPVITQYGCVFCRTSREDAVACTLEKQCAGLQATAVFQMIHKSENGRKSTEKKILLPGYVLFRTVNGFQLNPRHTNDVIRLLRSTEGSWQLQDADQRFAAFVFEQGGIIGLSQAHKVGDRVVIVSGPLKSMEGHILKIDRHRRNGQVEFQFDDRTWRIWLAFEMVE